MSDIRDEEYQDMFIESMEEILSQMKSTVSGNALELIPYPRRENVNPETGYLVDSSGVDTPVMDEVTVRHDKLLVAERAKKSLSASVQELMSLLEEAKPIKKFCVSGTISVTHSWSAVVEAKDGEEAEDMFLDLDGEDIANGDCYLENVEEFTVDVDDSDIDVSNVEEV